MKLAEFHTAVMQRVKTALNDHLQPQVGCQHMVLVDAMRYATLNTGKRMRPLLCFAGAQLFDPNALENKAVLTAACAIEMVHSYSLVHDDLPAMDDDDLRRGQPSTHIAFDQATAILTGDALQAKAFKLLSDNTVTAEISLKTVNMLALSCGEEGMVGGQTIDITAVGKQLTLEQLTHMHRLKTGALIKTSLELGAVIAGCRCQTTFRRIADIGDCLGLAFQIQDDILDCTASTEVLGKPRGADHLANKPTYVSLLGLDGAVSKRDQAQQQALTLLNSLGQINGVITDSCNSLMAEIVQLISQRTH